MTLSSMMAVWMWQAGEGATAGSGGGFYIWIALAAGVLGLLAAYLFGRGVLGSDTGTPEMQRISNAIRQGAEAFMRRQYSSIALIAVALAIALFLGYQVSPYTRPYAVKVVISFIVGAACSAQSWRRLAPIPARCGSACVPGRRRTRL